MLLFHLFHLKPLAKDFLLKVKFRKLKRRDFLNVVRCGFQWLFSFVSLLLPQQLDFLWEKIVLLIPWSFILNNIFLIAHFELVVGFRAVIDWGTKKFPQKGFVKGTVKQIRTIQKHMMCITCTISIVLRNNLEQFKVVKNFMIYCG